MRLTIALTLLLVACGSTLRATEAEAGYLAQQLKCVDDHDMRAAIDECRKAVRERWGIHETTSDLSLKSKDAGGQ